MQKEVCAQWLSCSCFLALKKRLPSPLWYKATLLQSACNLLAQESLDLVEAAGDREFVETLFECGRQTSASTCTGQFFYI